MTCNAKHTKLSLHHTDIHIITNNNNTDSIKTGASNWVTNIFFFFFFTLQPCLLYFMIYSIYLNSGDDRDERTYNGQLIITVLWQEISSDHSQKSFTIPELFNWHLNNRSIDTVGGEVTFLLTHYIPFLGKKLYWQSAYCTVQTSYGLWSSFFSSKCFKLKEHTINTYILNDI